LLICTKGKRTNKRTKQSNPVSKSEPEEKKRERRGANLGGDELLEGVLGVGFERELEDGGRVHLAQELSAVLFGD
jgi:hypothetical protein